MTTEVQQILPIPETVVVGSGSYTIPANKYAFISMSVTSARSIAWHARSSINTDNISGGGASASATSNEQWITAGVTISTAQSTGYCFVRLNGVSVCNSQSSVTNMGTGVVGAAYQTQANAQTVGWSASIFPIPKNNLPNELIVS